MKLRIPSTGGPSVCWTAVVDKRRVFGYRNDLMRWLISIQLIVFSAISVGMLLAAVLGSTSFVLAIGFSAAAAWNLYWFSWHFGWQVEVDGSTLRWRSVLRSRHIPSDALTGNGTVWFGGFERLTVRTGRSLLMMATGKGWVTFLAELQAALPSATFGATSSNRFGAKWPGSGLLNGYYEYRL